MSQSHERRARFRRLYEANHADLVRYALRRTGSPEDAADLVADTFLVAWRRLDDVPAGEPARLWLFGVARRVLANRTRTDQRRTRLIERLRAEPVGSAEAPADREKLDGARQALSRLRAAEREVLGLVAWEGLTIDELAQVLGCSKNAAKIRVHRARRRFAAELARLEGDEKRQSSSGHAAAEATTSASSTAEAP